MAVEDVQHFLFHFTGRQHIGPSLLLSLPGEESQIVPDLTQNGLGLALDFRKKHFLSAHVTIIHKNSCLASSKPAV
jgi:hypothetical protein